MHEPHIYAVSKGKDHKQYEYGTKASIVSTMKSNIIIGVSAHKKYEHDSKTLESALSSAKSHRNTPIIEGICDRGYKGKKEVLKVKICIPSTPLKHDTKYLKEKKRKKFKRRASIEPIIGHLKSDYRLSRNYLKGFIGDEFNLLMAATAWNLKRWINDFLRFVFAIKLALLIIALQQIKAEDRKKFIELALMIYRLY